METILKLLSEILFKQNISLNNFLLNIIYNYKIINEIINTKLFEETIDSLEFINKYNMLIESNDVKKYSIQLLSKNNLLILYDHLNDNKLNTDIFTIIDNNFKVNKKLKQYSKNLHLSTINQTIINKIFNELENLNLKKELVIYNLFSEFGQITSELLKHNYNINNLYCYDNNEINNLVHQFKIEIENDINLSNNIINLDILHNDIEINKSDLVICNIPLNLKNIIHASCSTQIKKLKIRGTKSEPLIIQLITTLLAKNGIAIVLIPDSFLFNDSKQHIDTREYLINNFNIKKIINYSNIKKSIIIFINNGKTQDIEFETNNNIITLKYDMIINNKFSLYTHNYDLVISKCPKNITNNNLNNYIKISLNKNEISDPDNNLLIIYKYNQLSIDKIKNIPNFDYVIETSNFNILDQSFLNYLLFQIINNKLDAFCKGKIKQIDINLILNIEIKLPIISIQQEIVNYIDENNKNIYNNNKIISNLINFKNIFINSIIKNKLFIKLESLCDIEHESNIINTIQINKNSIQAGTVKLTQEEICSSTNIYFLKNKKIMNNKCLYHILKFYEKDIQNLANQVNSIQLSKSKLENLKIPDLNIDEQNEILNCDIIDIEIEFYNKMNDNIKKRMFNLINIYTSINT